MKYCCSCSEAFQSSDWKCPHCLWSPPFAGGFPAFALPLSVANEGFADHYFSDLVSLETGHFWFESRNRLLASTLRNHFPAFQTFLEIGCGTGFVLSGLQKQFRHVRFSGSEIFSSGLAFAHDRLPSVQLFQMDARHIPFRDEYDVIGAFDVLEHIEEDEDVLRQMYQAVRPGGGILITVPQHPALWSAADDYAFHKRRYTRTEMVSKVQAAGFELVQVTSFVSLLLPVMLLSRLRHRHNTETYNPLAEFTINPGINRFLTAVMSLERQIMRYVSLPAGGSLLVAAIRRH